jgi:hypothetical protein
VQTRKMSRRPPECYVCACGEHAWARTNKWGVVLVSQNDADVLRANAWTQRIIGRLSYGTRSSYKNIITLLHRVVLGLFSSRPLVDHINRNGLDCRRTNLRICDSSSNLRNRIKKKNSKSRFLGVSYSAITPSSPWFARIKSGDTVYNIGRFTSEDDAAIAYNIHAIHIHGDFARPNKNVEWRHD